MPFPENTKQVLSVILDDSKINDFVKILRAITQYSGLKPPVFSQEEQLYPQQPDNIRELFGPLRVFTRTCPTTGWHHWQNKRPILDRKIYMIMIELSHVLNKLAEFNNKELEKQFVELITTKLCEIDKTTTCATTSKLLQDFHMFTKKQTISDSQYKTTSYISKRIFVNNGVLRSFCHPEEFISGIGRCFTSGSADLACVLCNEKNNDIFLIIFEYDGVHKSDEKKIQREARYKSLIGEQIKIGDKYYEGKLKGLQVVSGNSFQELCDKSFKEFDTNCQGISQLFQVQKGNKMHAKVIEIIEDLAKELPHLNVAPTGPSVTVAPTGPSVTVAPTGPSVTVAPTGPSVTVAPTTPSVTVAPTTPNSSLMAIITSFSTPPRRL